MGEAIVSHHDHVCRLIRRAADHMLNAVRDKQTTACSHLCNRLEASTHHINQYGMVTRKLFFVVQLHCLNSTIQSYVLRAMRRLLEFSVRL